MPRKKILKIKIYVPSFFFGINDVNLTRPLNHFLILSLWDVSLCVQMKVATYCRLDESDEMRCACVDFLDVDKLQFNTLISSGLLLDRP